MKLQPTAGANTAHITWASRWSLASCRAITATPAASAASTTAAIRRPLIAARADGGVVQAPAYCPARDAASRGLVGPVRIGPPGARETGLGCERRSQPRRPITCVHGRARGFKHHDRQRPAGPPLVVVEWSDGSEALPEPLVLAGARDRRRDPLSPSAEQHVALARRLEVEPPGGRAVGAGVGGHDREAVAMGQVDERRRARLAGSPSARLEQQDRRAEPVPEELAPGAKHQCAVGCAQAPGEAGQAPGEVAQRGRGAGSRLRELRHGSYAACAGAITAGAPAVPVMSRAPRPRLTKLTIQRISTRTRFWRPTR